MAVQPPGGLADVDGEVGGAFDRGDDPQGGDDLAEVGCDGRLQGQEAVAALLDGYAGGVEIVVGDDHPLGLAEVLGEQDVGGAQDVLGDGRRQTGDGLADVVEVRDGTGTGATAGAAARQLRPDPIPTIGTMLPDTIVNHARPAAINAHGRSRR